MLVPASRTSGYPACHRCPVGMTCLLIVVCSAWGVAVTSATRVDNLDSIVHRSTSTKSETKARCALNDAVCEKDWIGFEAIAQLHAQIDDDHNGSLDRLESDGFIREDLKYEDLTGHERLHGSDDFITVQELWHMWVSSSVYNWTVEDVVIWLVDDVELPQYVDSFRINAIDGRVLPRLASSSHAFGTILGIKNSVHRQKLSVKATDLVLFGPPKRGHHYLIDVAVSISLLVIAIGCSVAYSIRRSANEQTQKLMVDLASLQSAEDTLLSLQQQLDQTVKEQQKVASDRHDLEQKLRREVDHVKGEEEKLKQESWNDEGQLTELKVAEQELNRLRAALMETERRLDEPFVLPADLQQWLQVTYEIESRYFDAKRKASENQLRAAKEMCEKLHSQKGRFFSAMRIAHTTSLDDTDQTIYSVRCCLEEVRRALQERMQRWQQIERICGFNILTNPGLSNLEERIKSASQTRQQSPNSTGSGLGSHLDLDDADDEMPFLPVLAQASCLSVASTAAAAATASTNIIAFPRIRSVPVFHHPVSSRPELSRISLGSSGTAHSSGVALSSAIMARPTPRHLPISSQQTPHSRHGTPDTHDLSADSAVTFDLGEDASPSSPSSVAASIDSPLTSFPTGTPNDRQHRRSFADTSLRSTTFPSLLSGSVTSLSTSSSSSDAHLSPVEPTVRTRSSTMSGQIEAAGSAEDAHSPAGLVAGSLKTKKKSVLTKFFKSSVSKQKTS